MAILKVVEEVVAAATETAKVVEEAVVANNADKAKAAKGNGGPKSILLPAGT